MILCLCHPFSDKKAKEHMSEKADRCSVSEVYSACSGGNKPQCCSCVNTLKEMVKSHNSEIPA